MTQVSYVVTLESVLRKIDVRFGDRFHLVWEGTLRREAGWGTGAVFEWGFAKWKGT